MSQATRLLQEAKGKIRQAHLLINSDTNRMVLAETMEHLKCVIATECHTKTKYVPDERLPHRPHSAE